MMKAIYPTELNRFLEQVLGYAQDQIRQKEGMEPFFIIFPMKGDPQLHKFDVVGQAEPSKLLEQVDGEVFKSAKKKPKPRYAVVAYTDFVKKKPSVVLEAFALDQPGHFRVTQAYRKGQGKVNFSKNATLEYYLGHNPVTGDINRKKLVKGAFQKE